MFPATTYPKIRMDKFNRAELWHFSRFGFFRTFFRSSYLPQISSEKVATWSDCRFFNNKELLLVQFLDLAAIYASKHAKTPEILVASSHFLQFLACESHSFPPRVLKLGQNQDIDQRIKIYYYHFLIRLQLCLKTGNISKVASRRNDIFCFWFV